MRRSGLAGFRFLVAGGLGSRARHMGASLWSDAMRGARSAVSLKTFNCSVALALVFSEENGK